MEIKQLLLQQQLVAATRTGDLQKIEETLQALLWECVGVFETTTFEEEEDLVPLN